MYHRGYILQAKCLKKYTQMLRYIRCFFFIGHKMHPCNFFLPDAKRDQHFIKSILTGNHINESVSGVESTFTAILGREAATARREMTWDEIVFSNEKLDPKLNLAQFDKVK